MLFEPDRQATHTELLGVDPACPNTLVSMKTSDTVELIPAPRPPARTRPVAAGARRGEEVLDRRLGFVPVGIPSQHLGQIGIEGFVPRQRANPSAFEDSIVDGDRQIGHKPVWRQTRAKRLSSRTLGADAVAARDALAAHGRPWARW